MSDPVNFLSSYADIGVVAKAEYAYNWDFFVSGAVTEIDFSGQPFKFTNKVGFVMGLVKNRVTTLLK